MISGCDNAHFRSELRQNHCRMAVDQDNVHMKFSALNACFKILKFQPIGFKQSSVQRRSIWVPSSKRAIPELLLQSRVSWAV